MDKVISNYIEEVKAKQPKDYTLAELEDFLEEAFILYKYAEKDDRKTLGGIYNKLAVTYNMYRKDKIYKEHLKDKLEKDDRPNISVRAKVNQRIIVE